MPTSPVVSVVSGASFSVNTTAANLDPVLTVRDFIVLENGTLTLNPLSYTKTTQTSVSYSGPTLAANTSLELRRSTPRDQRTLVLPNTKVRASDWNLEFDRRVRIQEEVDLYGAGGGFTVRLPVNTAYGVSWQGDTLFSPTRQALYNQMQLYAPLASPTFTGIPLAPTPLTSDNSTKVATTAYVKSNLGLLAPLASPAFTGVPTVPTPLTSDNGTTIASTAYVKNNVAQYLPLAGGTLTGPLTGTTASFSGNVTVPTQLVTDNSTLSASTAYVKNNLTSFAPLASPTFTGVPTVPTFTNGVKTTQAVNALNLQRRAQPIVIARKSTALSLAANTFTDVVYDVVLSDSMGAYNSTTGVFTAPYTGVYEFKGLCAFTSTSAGILSLVQVTGTELVRLADQRSSVATTLSANGSVLEKMNAGDTRKFNVLSTSATTTFADTSRGTNYMSINYIGIDTAS